MPFSSVALSRQYCWPHPPSDIIIWCTCLAKTLSSNLSESWKDCEPLRKSVLSRNCRFSNKRHRNNERRNKKPQKSGKPWRRPTATDPVSAAFVASLPRPGGNLTGFINIDAGMADWPSRANHLAGSRKQGTGGVCYISLCQRRRFAVLRTCSRSGLWSCVGPTRSSARLSRPMSRNGGLSSRSSGSRRTCDYAGTACMPEDESRCECPLTQECRVLCHFL
jgi:hypothetical protein